MSTKRITVLLAEDHMVLREGLGALLGTESDIEVIAEAETGRQAVAMTRKFRPAVVVMDKTHAAA
jgi:DNA-binding NarL/FixJ family response regulator